MASIDKFPGVQQYLDDTDAYDNSATETNLQGSRLLVVTQTGPIDSGQLVFRWNGEVWEPYDADTFVELSGNERSRSLVGFRAACSKSSEEDHEAVHNLSVQSVDSFSSASGPDGGNLACVWAVRHIVHNALGRWVTQTDATAILDVELQRCYGRTWQEADTLAGGIVISPTQTLSSGRRNIGHVGLLGPDGHGDRLIYSNSSSAAKWKQNFTLGSWKARYQDTKGLPVRFYPLPFYVG
jgi:hypothetical protein